MSAPLEKELSKYPLVALVGRVNVGKSTLFNRLIEEQKALESPVPGTTRDVNYGMCDWRGSRMIVVDTGGFVEKPKSDIEKKVFAQAEKLIKRATIILFMLDTKEGINPDDKKYLAFVRKTSKAKIMLIANKADRLALIQETYNREWLALGMGRPIPTSAASGLGVGDMLDMVLEALPKKVDRPTTEEEPIRIAIVGRTNVGKSSMINKMLGEERVIVSDTPHTTREPQDTAVTIDGQPYVLIDTVGIRKRNKMSSVMEREGVTRSIKNIEKSDVVVLVLEANVSPSKQESRLAQIAVDNGRGIIIVVNKWDLVAEKQTKSLQAYETYFKSKLKFISWAPVLFISALTGQRTSKILDLAREVQGEREHEIPQDELDVFLKKAIIKQKPIWILGQKKPIIYGFRQEKIKPPTFALAVKQSPAIQYMYLRYLENRLRETFGYQGTPVAIFTEQVIKERYEEVHFDENESDDEEIK
ncbi:MAG: ribosome biogenesis GTPase Der [bacterium]|nr:ribosome biogenesis GTPase Der [bacterium]